MRVGCPGCGTIYGVDPDKVPEGGIRARCARCPTVFHVGPTGDPSIESGDSVEGVRDAVEPEPSVGVASTGYSAPAPAPAPETPHPAGPGYEAGGAEAAIGEASQVPAAPSFGSADPHERARRLARALVSDIATYHGDRLDRGLREGNLRLELGAEIRKSWDEYMAQVGNQIARETSYFRDALNEILARGARHF